MERRKALPRTVVCIMAVACITLLSCAARKHLPTAVPPNPVLPLPTEEQMAWHEMELNAFIHFTTNTFTNKEWGFGNESPSVFNPSSLDVMQWVRTLKASGFKGVILTAKHHDGFCLWPSAYTEHSVKASPWKEGRGDVVKELSEGCRKEGLKFGVYVSPWDRNRADYGTPAYIEYYRNQLRELFTRYGPVFEMWFDGANGGDGYYGGANERRRISGATYYDWPGTLQVVRSLQPKVLFFSDAGPHLRWVGNERGVAGETNWNTISNDTLYAGKAGIENLLNTGSEDGTKWIPAEVDVSIRKGWFYHQSEDALVKTPEQLFGIYLTSVGRGSTLLLNIPPDQRGLIHENDVAALAEFRKLLDERFKNNLAVSATADKQRGTGPSYAAGRLVDGNKDSYWTTDDSDLSASVTINLEGLQTVRYIVMQEYIRLGQRVRSFAVDVWKENRWVEISSATTIGYKRILAITPVSTNQIRVRILSSKAAPVLSNIEVY